MERRKETYSLAEMPFRAHWEQKWAQQSSCPKNQTKCDVVDHDWVTKYLFNVNSSLHYLFFHEFLLSLKYIFWTSPRRHGWQVQAHKFSLLNELTIKYHNV